MSTDRLRIAMLIWSYWPGHEGGAERQCRKLIPWLAKSAMEIEVWTARTRFAHLPNESMPDHRILRFGGWIPVLLSMHRGIERGLVWIVRGSVQNARSRSRLREALSFWIGLPLIWLARCKFLFDVWRHLRQPTNRPDIIHVHESSWLAGAAVLLARRHGIPVLIKTAIYPAWNKLGYDLPLRGKLSEARRDGWFAALAPYLADDLAAHGISRDKIFSVPNGVEIPAEMADGAHSLNVLLLANFSQGVEHKAFDVLLDAWRMVAAAVPAAQLWMLGDGDASPWKALVRTMRLESSVQFMGWVANPAEYFRRASVFVLPSRVEGVSNALLEAQSWGLACVVSDIPGNRAVVEAGHNGLVAPVGDAEALAEAMLRLLGDAPLRESLGSAARQRMAERFSLESVARQLAAIYRQLVAEPSRPEKP